METRGQPTLLTPDMHKRIIAHLQTGITPERAATAAGVSARAHHNWRKRGLAETERRNEGETPNRREDRYVQYVQEIEAAKASAEAYHAGQVSRAAAPRQVTITRTRTRPRKHGNSDALDAEGHVIMVTETTVEVREEWDWRAAAWMLERLNPETWAAITRTELSGPGGGPVQVEQLRAQALALIDELRLRRSVPAAGSEALAATAEAN